MNHSQITRNATDKFKLYTIEQCRFAITDIHETLQFNQHADDMDNPYVVKLWAELDAARDRMRVLSK